MTSQEKTARERAIDFYESIVPADFEQGEHTDEFKDVDELAYLLSRVPAFTSRPLRIAAIGAGISGISLARAIHIGTIKKASLTVFEKNADVAGTWYENRYPGCACDIPAASYQFPWAPNPNWSSFYAEQPEICEYITAVVDQHGLRPYIKTSHKVTEARWDEKCEVWKVTVAKTDGRELVVSKFGVTDGESDTTFTEDFDILINCSGYFNNWNWPDVKHRDSFKGRLLHSAAWPADADKDIHGKTVALIGNGSSGVQILPAIIDKVDKVYVHMKSRTWITTGIGAKFAGPGGQNFKYSEEQKGRWTADPVKHLEYRREVEDELDRRFSLYIRNSPIQKAARDFCTNDMRTKLCNGNREKLFKDMLPDFAVGCRRPTPGNGYLEALCSPKCEVVWGKVEKFTPDGLQTDSGHAVKGIDTIICATGFDTTYAPRFPVTGQNGIDFRARMIENPASYLSVTAADMPNFFTILGPLAPTGHGGINPAVEQTVKYICDMLGKMQTQNYSSVVPKPKIPAAYQRQALAWLSQSAWVSHCTSTYKSGTRDGQLTSPHPGSRLHFLELLATPRYEDFEWKSLCEDLPFAWHANGFTEHQRNPGPDTKSTWFLDFDKHTVPVKKSGQRQRIANGVS